MADPEQLRLLAERTLAMAVKATDPKFTEWLSIKASEFLEQAQALEATARGSLVEAPPHVVQQAQQPQPVDPEAPE
jgi:hypothetical protein